LLADLGLKRRSRDVGSLVDYLREKATANAPTAPTASAAEEIGESPAVNVDAADAAVCGEEPTE
jgi:hypothetical protein